MYIPCKTSSNKLPQIPKKKKETFFFNIFTHTFCAELLLIHDVHVCVANRVVSKEISFN
jgi:hypothetical protein